MDNLMHVCVDCLLDVMEALSKSATVTHINDADSTDGYQPGTCEQCKHHTEQVHRLLIMVI